MMSIEEFGHAPRSWNLVESDFYAILGGANRFWLDLNRFSGLDSSVLGLVASGDPLFGGDIGDLESTQKV